MYILCTLSSFSFPPFLPSPLRKRKYSEITHEVLRSPCPDVDWNAVNSDGNTPLMVALLRRHLNKVQHILDKGQTDVTIQNNDGNTVLILALQSYRRTTDNRYAFKIFELIQKIVTINPSVVNVRPRTICTPLMQCDNVDLCRFLVAYGAKLNLRNTDKETAIFNALWNFNYEKLQFLLEAGAHVNIKNTSGNTILAEATNKRFRPTYVRLLLKHGAKIMNPFIAVEYHASEFTLEVLLESGLDVDYTCPNCKATMLHVAVKGTHCDKSFMAFNKYKYISQRRKIEILLASGADTTKRDLNGHKAYDWFISGNPEMKSWWYAMKNKGKLDALLTSAVFAYENKSSEETFFEQFMTQVPSASDLLQDVASYLAY